MNQSSHVLLRKMANLLTSLATTKIVAIMKVAVVTMNRALPRPSIFVIPMGLNANCRPEDRPLLYHNAGKGISLATVGPVERGDFLQFCWPVSSRTLRVRISYSLMVNLDDLVVNFVGRFSGGEVQSSTVASKSGRGLLPAAGESGCNHFR
jgi:hypothetical protein